jgi:hypothetical protein
MGKPTDDNAEHISQEVHQRKCPDSLLWRESRGISPSNPPRRREAVYSWELLTCEVVALGGEDATQPRFDVTAALPPQATVSREQRRKHNHHEDLASDVE